MAGELPTPIPAPVVFPYEPDGAAPIKETWGYFTNIITSENDSEQRIPLRSGPGLTLEWLVTEMDNSGRLSGLIYANPDNRWYVPLWSSARVIESITGANPALRVYALKSTGVPATIGSLFSFPQQALVWASPTQWDIMTVLSGISTGSVPLRHVGGETSFPHKPGMIVVPLGIGLLDAQQQLNRSHGVTTWNVKFEIDRTNVAPIAPTDSGATFRGGKVLSFSPSAASSEQEAWVQSSERSGTAIGPQISRPLGATPVVSRPKTWIFTDFAEVGAWRAWLAYRRGRLIPTWVPSYVDDFVLAAAPVQDQFTLDIQSVDFENQYLPFASRQNIALLVPPDTVYPFRVTAVDALGAVDRLHLDSGIPVNLPIGTRCCVLAWSRLATDDVTLEFLAQGVAQVAMNFVEVPREVPA